jgi:crossover junction endodeoxyribonuclease RuvC
MRVLGIDCGTECTGYGVVDLDSRDKLGCVSFGGIRLSAREPLPHRLSVVFDRLSALMQHYQPDRVAIEEVFYSVNAKSALKLGQVRGVAMLAASAQKIQISEYAPLTIKASVVGYGRAEKEQVQLARNTRTYRRRGCIGYRYLRPAHSGHVEPAECRGCEMRS